MAQDPSEDPRTRAHERTRGPMASSDGGPLLGAFLGHYAILGEIARGGMGAVYRARRAGESDVALKVLLKLDRATPEMIRRFEREVRTGRALDHPGIVKVLDAGNVDGKLYFAMELVEGQPFGALTLPLEQRIRILEKVCRAVGHAHERGFVHRDLKPPNILVTRGGEPKVLDFGLAKSLDKESLLTQDGAILGTFAYMAPEQADGRHDSISAATDVWALGAILYETLTGALPFKADSHVALLARILNEDARDPCALSQACPAPLAAVALRALEKEPALRFRDANGLADELARWLAVGEVETRARSAWSRFLRRRKSSLVAGAIVLVAVTAAAISILSVRGRDAALRAKDFAATANEAELALQRFARTGEAPAPTLVLHAREIAGEPITTPERENEALPRSHEGVADPVDRLAHALRGASVAASATAPVDADLPDLLAAETFAPEQPALRKAIAERFLARGSPDRALAYVDSATATRLRGDLEDDRLIRATHDPRFETDPGAVIHALRTAARDGATPELAWTLLRAERGEEALADFDRVLHGARGLGRAEALAGKAEALLLLARDDEARGCLEEAIRLLEADPDLRGDFVERRARLRVAMLRREGAARDRADAPRLVRASRVAFRRFVRHGREVDGALARALLDLAERLASDATTVRLERARQAWESGERLDPPFVATLRDLADPVAMLLVALVCLDGNEAPRARDLALRAIGAKPEREVEAAAHAVAGIAVGESDPRTSLDELEKAIALWRELERNRGQDALEVRAWEQKAKDLAALGKSDEAGRAHVEAQARALPDRLSAPDCKTKNEGANLDDPLSIGAEDRTAYLAPLKRRRELDPFDAYTSVNLAKNVFFKGADAGITGDPWCLLGRGLRTDPTQLNDLIGLRAFLHSMSAMFSSPAETDEPSGEDALWARIANRAIVVLHKADTIDPKDVSALRLDCERALSLDPSRVAALVGRGYLRAISDERSHA
ncbi:MAG TPA: serine/threonine-protein kinase, partial [Planctomycetota bacterium]|nr:serine/threonine-protein kinase [Planctomycetota bacterium]